MKNLIIFIIVCIIVSLTITSCKKKEEPSPTPAPSTPSANTVLLTGKNWLITTFVSDMDDNGSKETDVYALMYPCELDNLLIFNSGSTTTNDEGATKCSTSDPQTTSGTWSFNTAETVINIDGESWSIETLNATTLKVNFVRTHSMSITFTKQ